MLPPLVSLLGLPLVREATLSDFYSRLDITEQGHFNLQDVAAAPAAASVAAPLAAPPGAAASATAAAASAAAVAAAPASAAPADA